MHKNLNRTIARASWLLMAAALVQSCDKDVLEGQPSWLGESIYEQLQGEGNYTNTLRLIDDLGQKEVLSQTGSKTLFVADDDAFAQFFAGNDWGVKSYEGLSTAQKKLLLNSAMVNNAYLVELLSSVSGNPPQDGKCMRRATAASVYDSIPKVFPDWMPNTQYWTRHKGKTSGMLLMRNNSTKPMIHFLPKYMTANNITDDDLRILTNGVSTSTADAWVNGMKIVERDKVCKNGYIHKVSGVMTSSDNMAEIVGKKAQLSQYNALLGRFCAPYYSQEATEANARINGVGDSVFVLKYFVSSGSSESPFTDPDGKAVDAYLSYDPGDNQYIYSNTSAVTFDYDAGAMLVPSNAALEAYWNGEGRVLQDIYKTWDNVPMTVISKLLNINMINAFSETVPSKFDNIVDNTTKVSIGIQPADVDSCFMGCNGVVYQINKVFAPADYSSVSFPALVNEKTMNIIYWGISNLDYEPYLNSMDSKYSFFIPTNSAMVNYIDPCTYGNSVQTLYSFYYDNEAKKVKAHRVGYDMATGMVNTSVILDDASDDQVKNRLNDLIDNLIVVGDVEDGHTYYKTKGGSMLKVDNAGKEGTMTVSGGLQVVNGNTLPRVDTIYTETNGRSYVLGNALPMSSPKSVYATLRDNDQYSEFFKLLSGASSLLAQKLSGKYTCADYNISLFDVYNYTVYVPTNEAIKQLQAEDLLPSWEDYDNLTAADFGGDSKKLTNARKALQDRIVNFLRYHFQDNSVMIGGTPVSDNKYESFTINNSTKRFYSMTVSADDNAMSITDQVGNTRHVVKAAGAYNNICRDIWIQGTSDSNYEIYNASDAVVHSIDGCLLYQQPTSWREELENLKK